MEESSNKKGKRRGRERVLHGKTKAEKKKDASEAGRKKEAEVERKEGSGKKEKKKILKLIYKRK